jgi:menaquinone-dependent protoporphyrinogen oxidase
MRVLIAHASRLGSTREIAERLGATLRSPERSVIVESVSDGPDPSAFDAVVVGSAVYAGHWLPEATAWVDRHARLLHQRHLWLFSSGPLGSHAATAAPTETAEVSRIRREFDVVDHRVFAGSLDREHVDEARLGRVETFVARHFVPEGDFRSWDAVDAWAGEIGGLLVTAPA